MNNNRTVRGKYLAISFAAVCGVGLLVAGVLLVRRPVPEQITSLTYTNAITGQTAEDKPTEIRGQTPQPNLDTASATIFGMDQFNAYLTDGQISNLHQLLADFLMAHSGLDPVTAGIRDDQLTQINTHTIQFTLVVVRPQVTYRVRVFTANQSQAVPQVAFEAGE